MKYLFLNPSTIGVLLDGLIVVALSARVVMKRPATGDQPIRRAVRH